MLKVSASIAGPVLASLITEFPETRSGLLIGTSNISSEKIITDENEAEEVNSRHLHIQEYRPNHFVQPADSPDHRIVVFSIRKDSYSQPSFGECMAAHSISRLMQSPALLLVINLPDNHKKWVLGFRFTCYYIDHFSKIPSLIDLQVPNLSSSGLEKYKSSRFLNSDISESPMASALLALSIQQCVMSQAYAHSVLDEIWVSVTCFRPFLRD